MLAASPAVPVGVHSCQWAAVVHREAAVVALAENLAASESLCMAAAADVFHSRVPVVRVCSLVGLEAQWSEP